MPSVKRRRAGDDGQDTTPRKRCATPVDDEEDEILTTPSKRATPLKRQNGVQTTSKDLNRTKLSGAINGEAKGPETPRSQRRVLFATPSKHQEEESETVTPTIVRNADRSARRKSARRLLERTINGDRSDDEEALEEEDALARQIWDEEADELGEEEDIEIPSEAAVPETPTKRGRGRPKGSKNRKRSLTPPENLPAHELYFWQNRPGGTKTSNNTLPSHAVLNHDEYFAQMQKYKDNHDPDKEFLHSLHSRSFDQWVYELEHDFNICLYGYGSKRALAQDFATHLYDHHAGAAPSSKTAPKIVIINGYNPSLTPRDILTTILATLVPSSLKLPAQSPLLLNLLLTTLTTKPPAHPITLLINSIDAPSLRRPSTQSLLAQLAAHPSISLFATADTPTFPLLWDLSLRSQFRFLFHDCTTFASFAPIELDAVEAFNELLGRSGRRVGGRDGVGFVLRSLPENARALFRILVAEQLAASADDDDAALLAGAADDFDDIDNVPATPSKRGRPSAAAQAARAAAAAAAVPAVGVEYRVLYHKAVEEFVCSNEMGFRTLLKEFHDHQMIESRKDVGGVERLWVPFRREDLEALLEELVE